MTKRTEDRDTGEQRREIVADQLGKLLVDTGILIHRMGPVGMDYQIEYHNQMKPIMFRFFTDPELFYKLPRGYKRDDQWVQRFIDSVLLDYHVLFLNDPINDVLTHYRLEPMHTFTQRWRLSDTPGNENRLKFLQIDGRVFAPVRLKKFPIPGGRNIRREKTPTLFQALCSIFKK
jgi:hypothetical protein